MDQPEPNCRIVSQQDSQISLSERGQWLLNGEPFENQKIIEFFHRAIRKDDEGRYYLHNAFDGRRERVYFRVEDTAYFVHHLLPKPDGKSLLGSLNIGQAVEIDPRSFEQDERGVLVCRVLDGDRARLTTNALHELAELAQQDESGIFLVLAGERFDLSPGP
jgi:hypothetical protein